MKNVINYFYNLQPDNIRQQGKQFRFDIDNNSYVFLPYCRLETEIKDLQLLATFLLSLGIYCHQFVFNINSTIITVVNNKPYVLLLVYLKNNRILLFEDLIWFTEIKSLPDVKSLRTDDWFSLWTRKIDYFEYQVNQFGKTYPLLRESFSYFVGMAEIGISLLKRINNNYKATLSLSYRRIKKDEYLFELYNPLNFIIDNKVRSICEYFKDNFFKGKDLTEYLFNYISYNNLNETDGILLYARMLFPTFYFDMYEKIIHEEEDEKEILKIISKVDDYELFLKKLYNYLRTYINIPEIEWISKKT